MKIGYARYSQSFHLDFLKASAKMLGTELRLGILEALLDLGHQVYILSQIPRNHLHILDGSGEIYNYSKFKNIKYSPEEIPNLDLLIIEASTTNIKFGGEAILRIKDILSKYSGMVAFYHHSDKISGFPLGAIYNGEATGFKLPKGVKEPNYKTLFRDVDFKDKEWILWTHADPQNLISRMSGDRFRYDLFDKSFSFLLGYSPIFDTPKRIRQFSKRQYDLVYIGRQKTPYRTRRLIELYGDDKCKRLLYGFWQDPPIEFEYKGFISGHGNMYDLYGDSVASIVTGDSFFLETGLMTTRVIQSIRAGCITFIDKEFLNAEQYVDKEFIINCHEDTHSVIGLSDNKLKDLLILQRHKLCPWTTSLFDVIKRTV